MGSIQSNRKMTQDYERRNLEGWEGDHIMRGKFQQLVKDKSIDMIVELGSYLGGTTKQLTKMVGHVVTVEINLTFYMRAVNHLADVTNVTMYNADSVFVLPSILEATKQMKLLIFVDSHWESNNPLLAELEIIANAGIKPVIAIHDFKVPGHPELGFDTYGDIVYEWSWIEKSIEKIYGVDGFTVEYNSEAVGAKRGIIYIFPK